MSTEISPQIAAEIHRLRSNALDLIDLPLTAVQRAQLQHAIKQLDTLPKLYAESWLMQALWEPAGRIRAVARQLAAAA
jgi:hypothetical protein